MKNLKVLAINSFAIHGMASLKSSISILKDLVLPVPTVLLAGLANMPGVQKHNIDFEKLLEETFNLVQLREQHVILYIGYLGSVDQVDFILSMINKYRKLIKTILVDPIVGDHGKLYVPQDIADRWADLIKVSDFAFPNVTELKHLTGNTMNDEQPIKIYGKAFTEQFPNTQLIITSLTTSENKTGIMRFDAEQNFTYTHELLRQNYSGTGDTFVSLFILHFFYKKLRIDEALKLAADGIVNSILYSMEEQADELLLEQFEY